MQQQRRRCRAMIKKIEEAVEYLDTKIPGKPRFGLITGTGLGNLTDKMDVHGRFPYEEIPHFPRSTVAGHSGQLVYGTLANRPVLYLSTRKS